jgi:tetratricopeptide (TPR) repeat protein
MWKLFGITMLWACAAAGETVHLADGSTVHGKIYRSGSDWTLVLSSGATRTLSASDVISIDMDSAGNPGAELDDQLASLRHSLEFSDNPVQAIVRLQNFIQHNPGSAAAQAAQKDLQIWQDRNDRHLVKIGDDWITQDQAQQLRDQTVLIADHARQLIRDGDISEATKLVNRIVAVDPHGVPGLYLQGVLACNTNQLALAEKDFLAVAALAPQHGPTLNNLAVFSFRQQHFAQAAIRYDQALQADPLQRQIIDNVAEMFHAFPPGLNLPEVRALQQTFARQEMTLERTMAAGNLIRWGAKWVTVAQMKQIQAAQKIIQQKLDQLAADQTQLQTQIASWDQQIANDIDSQQTLVTPLVLPANTPGSSVYPTTYYDLQRDIIDLKARRLIAVGKLGDIAVAMRGTQSLLPIQPYTGMQLIIGEEGTPIAPPKAATQPSTTKPAVAL